MRVRVRAVLGLGSWLLGVGSGCGPTVQGDPSSDDGTSTPTSGTTTSTEDVTTMTTSPTTTGPMTTTEGLDDGPRLDLPTDVGMEECVDWATMGCGIPGPRGVVTAMTPQGDFETTVAVFGGMIGCGGWCPGALSPNLQRIVLASSPAMLQDLQPFDLVDETLAIEFDVFEGPLGVPVPARLWASRDGQSSSAEGAEVVMDLLPTAEEVSEPFDPGRAAVVTGTLTLDAPGWNVSGAFAASYCPQINEYYICE